MNQVLFFLGCVAVAASLVGAPLQDRWSEAELTGEKDLREQWKSGAIGNASGIMKPWTAMRVESLSIFCVGRCYRYGDSLLPEQIESNGIALLAASPYLLLRCGETEHRLSVGKSTLRRVDDESVVAESEGHIPGAKLHVLAEYEFDGMAKISMSLQNDGTNAEFDSMELVFPLRAETCRFFHYITMGEGGRPPKTDVGPVPDAGFSLDEFRGLFWFGDDQVGFCWFAENMKNWPLQDEKNVQSLGPERSGMREFKIKLGDRRFRLEKPLEIEFGIQATPSKPRDPDFRRKSDRSTLSWNWCWGDGYYYPFAADYTAARAHVEAERKRGLEVMPCSSLYFYGMFRFHSNQFGELENPGLLHRELKLWGSLWSRNNTGGETRFKPWRALSDGRTEWDVSAPLDLAPNPETWFGKVNQPQALVRLCINSEFQDYYVFRFAGMVRETGLKAIYLDGTIGTCDNIHHGCGYIDYNGNMRGSAPIFAMRRLMKRLRRILYERHGESRICMHESGRISVPVLSLADTFLDGENYASGPLQVQEFYSKLLTSDRLLAEHTGIQFGFAPEFLPEFTASWRDKRAPTPASTRDLLGLMFIHDNNVSPQGSFHLPMISFMQKIRLSYFPECDQVSYYWRSGQPVAIAQDDVRYILHYGVRRGLLILFNWSDRVQDAEVKLDLARIFPKNKKIRTTDAVGGEIFSMHEGNFVVPLAPRDFRMIDLSVDDGGGQ